MARTFCGIEDTVGPGTLVYEPFYPQNPGVVRAILSDTMKPMYNAGGVYDHRREIVVEVEWRKRTQKRKKVTKRYVSGLQSFEALIEEHKRKYDKQTALAEELREKMLKFSAKVVE